MKSKNVLIGIVGGLAAGTLLGILFAPAKGSETRKKIADKRNDLKSNLKDSVSKISEKIASTTETIKSQAQETVQEGKSNLDNLKSINKSSVL